MVVLSWPWPSFLCGQKVGLDPTFETREQIHHDFDNILEHKSGWTRVGVFQGLPEVWIMVLDY